MTEFDFVIPGRPAGPGPESMHSGVPGFSSAGVHSFQARGRRPRPGMTVMDGAGGVYSAACGVICTELGP
jgi:hypothetical protein